jgi:hypothetical protein
MYVEDETAAARAEAYGVAPDLHVASLGAFVRSGMALTVAEAETR